MALMDRAQIMEIIPHRDPFLLIDEIESMDEEKARLPRLNMSGNQNTISKDIFLRKSDARRAHRGSSGPGRGCRNSQQREVPWKAGFFGGIKNAKFGSQVTPEILCGFT